MIKKIKNKKSEDWFDTHVEFIGFGSSTKNKKVKSILKQNLIKKLSKEIL